jgi:hypothetical protein
LERVGPLTIAEYEGIRRDPRRFIIAAGHASGIPSSFSTRGRSDSRRNLAGWRQHAEARPPYQLPRNRWNRKGKVPDDQLDE